MVPAEIMDSLRDRGTRIAVVGASNHPAKYGNIITRDLAAKGYPVFPVNPHETEIAGLVAYRTVGEVPAPVHIANFVVPPEVTLAVLRGLDPASVPVVWFQPGAFDEEVVSFARKRFRHVVAGDCIMVVTRLV
jgi:hypothetical protein